MKQRYFPFGRGERGTQQRVLVVLEVRRTVMVYHSFTVEVAQTGGSNKVLLRLATSKWLGKRDFVVSTNFKDFLECSLRGVKMFRVTRTVNKLHRNRRAGKDVEAQREKFYQLTKARQYVRQSIRTQ